MNYKKNVTDHEQPFIRQEREEMLRKTQGIAKEKAALRTQFRRIRDDITGKTYRAKSHIISQKLKEDPVFSAADQIFCYLASGSEVDTWELIEYLLDNDKQVAVPLCHPATRTMEAAVITSVSQLAPGPFGVFQPHSALAEEGRLTLLSPKEIPLVLVPALAFDRDGYRLGYGGGYYDRFLKDCNGLLLGLAFQECVTDRLPREPHDLPVTRLVTDEL